MKRNCEKESKMEKVSKVFLYSFWLGAVQLLRYVTFAISEEKK